LKVSVANLREQSRWFLGSAWIWYKKIKATIGSFYLCINRRYQFLAASREALRKAFICFSSSKEVLRARVPAALLPFSA
jgi:hypothetical protein